MSLEAYLRNWVGSHDASLVPAALVEGFARHLQTLPWAGTHLDWASLPGKSIDLEAGDPDAEGTLLAKYSAVLAFYDEDSNAVAGPAGVILSALDELYWMSPGHRYICGAYLAEDGGWNFDYQALGEFDDGRWLTLLMGT